MESDPGEVVAVRYMPLLTFNNFTQITKYALNRGSPTLYGIGLHPFCGLARGPHMKK